VKLLRLSKIIDKGGYSRSTQFNLISDGLFTKPVKIGLRSSAWPEFEANAINAARIAGWNDSEIRRLVTELHEFRKNTPGKTDSEIHQGVAQLVAGIRKRAA